ncbi:glycosyltransferase family 2 protein [Tumidithrix elongata RA019]|uniref:Glycosyltransferase family 2 protein n=1 Tax=Tumidithrix elongata BACA0141 TaxID=2716417 RepID=A0AAW9PYX0_9CYAN|nr:glycosyltransferase family 2 protein [Tumidithrix elongata RA019]
MQNSSVVSPQKSLSVVVPVYNEQLTLELVLERLIEIVDPLEIIVVDDGSSDGTNLILESICLKYSQIRPIYHSKNRGKTAALISGFSATSGDIVIVQDADLEYNPEEISMVIEPILHGEADVVYGSRFLVRKAARVLYFYHFLANKFLTFLSNLLTNVNMTDVETGYKAFKGEIIRNMVITSSGFGFEIEVTAKIAKLNCRIYEVPISYYGRTYEEGKKIGIKDGLLAIWYIIYFNLFCSLKASFRAIPESFLKKGSKLLS